MTVHKSRTKRLAEGAKCGRQRRIMVSLPPEDMALVTWFADKKGIPVSMALRG